MLHLRKFHFFLLPLIYYVFTWVNVTFVRTLKSEMRYFFKILFFHLNLTNNYHNYRKNIGNLHNVGKKYRDYSSCHPFFLILQRWQQNKRKIPILTSPSQFPFSFFRNFLWQNISIVEDCSLHNKSVLFCFLFFFKIFFVCFFIFILKLELINYLSLSLNCLNNSMANFCHFVFSLQLNRCFLFY